MTSSALPIVPMERGVPDIPGERIPHHIYLILKNKIAKLLRTHRGDFPGMLQNF